MRKKISRRDFLKMMGASAATAAVLTGCGPISRYVVREPYTKMPEYSYNGLSTYYASTCRECPAGCGIVVRTMQGRALKVEGNPNNPVNLGKTCSRGQAALQGLYNPDRIQHPYKQMRGRTKPAQLTWDEAVAEVKQAISSNPPAGIAFLLGMTSDHLADLVTEITTGLGAPAPWRYGALEMFDGRTTLAKAASQVFNKASLPFFDLGNADLTFSFGANFLETFLSPVAYGRGYSAMRRGVRDGKRGYLVQFEPRLSQTAAAADEWIPVVPGSAGLVALGIGRAAAQLKGGSMPAAYQNVDLGQVADASGVSQATLKRLAGLFANAAHALAIPGGSALEASNGLEAGQAILALNVLVKNLGQTGGVFLTPSLPVHASNPVVPNTFKDMENLVALMKSGSIKVLFIHGINPVFELPTSLEFTKALANVPTVISFASFPDETSQQADYIFPDHTGLESWGYQKIVTGGDRAVISGAQPTVVPFYDTKATADVLLAAVQSIGGALAGAVRYKDEVEFLHNSLQKLMQEPGYFNAPEIQSFWAQWQQYGGWWNASAGLDTPTASNSLGQSMQASPAEFDGIGDYYLLPFPSALLSDGSGANKPWLQETPDPTTTVMWNTWIEIHPDTADKLGIKNDDVVKVSSPFGELEASVYLYPAIRPDTIAIPFGQGHTVFGRYAQGRGANLAGLLGTRTNGADGLATLSLRVKIEKTGRQKPLARMESVLGVYGNFNVSGE
jgi:anaerobic selenocysteine-containing dehydrogenase